MPLEDALVRHASISIIGMCKNAGKTTALNALIARAEAEGLALTSIGRDGEGTDVVTGTEKPGIWVSEGTLIATAAGMLRFCDTSREIVSTTGFHTPVGEVVIFRARSDGFVQLAGPSMLDQLRRLSETLRDLGARRILIDGAISRKTLGAPTVCEATILCTGASYHPDMQTVIEDTAHACRVLTLPREEALWEPPKDESEKAVCVGEGHFYIHGAATDTTLRDLRGLRALTTLDASRMMLSRALFERLAARGVRFSVIRPAKLDAVCVNPVSVSGADFDAKAFLKGMRDAVHVPVYNVKEMRA